MGQKVNPIGLRVGINRTWDSRWYAEKGFADLLHEDIRIREFLEKDLVQAGVSRIIIERPCKKMPGNNLFRTSWCNHRQKRRRYRKTAQQNCSDDDIRSSFEYRRNP